MSELKLSKDLNVITAEINSYKQVAGQVIFGISNCLIRDVIRAYSNSKITEFNIMRLINKFINVVRESFDNV